MTKLEIVNVSICVVILAILLIAGIEVTQLVSLIQQAL